MFHVVLFEPEIPPNTGNIIRLCANTGCTLHLIEPLGFNLDDKSLKRAGLDYRERTNYIVYNDLTLFLKNQNLQRIFLCSTRASTIYTDINFNPGDIFIFGPETRGLPSTLLADFPDQQKIRIPMKDTGRSLNLATATGIVIYEAWRQQNFQ